jgi:hypothetical protein
MRKLDLLKNNMNALITSTKSLALVALMIISSTSCSKKSDDDSGSTPQKSLNKSTFAPKKWYSEGSSVIHDFKAGGVYGNVGGSWKWKNNSDTLEIVIQSGFPASYWKVYWNTETEMECEKEGTFTRLLYKDKPW